MTYLHPASKLIVDMPDLVKIRILKVARFRKRVLLQVTVGDDVRSPKWVRENDAIYQGIEFKADIA